MIKSKLSRQIVFAMLGVILPIAICAAAPKPQDSQTESVADAAKKARAQKSKDPKATKVYTDDNIGNVRGSISVIGPGSEPAETKTTAGKETAGTTAGDKSNSKDEAYWRSKFAEAHAALSTDARELDIEQREFNLKQTQFYTDPNVALREQNDRKDINDSQAKIDEQKAKVEKDKQAIADLEEELRKAGGDPGWAQDTAALPVPAQPPSDGQPNNPAQAPPATQSLASGQSN
jgi:hypothetical protein